MDSAAWRLRAGVLLLAGALVVHRLRYALAGTHADEHAHAYLSWLGPLVCATLLAALVEFGFRVGRRARDVAPVPRAGIRWLAFAALLIAIFAIQETAEMLAAHGRLEVSEALVAHGGWLAGPVSLAVAAVIALLLRGARALLERVAGAQRTPQARLAEPRLRLARPARARPNVLARKLAGRAPPPSFVI